MNPKEKLTLIICGDIDSEYNVYIEHGGKYFEFFCEEWGFDLSKIKGFLKFLGFEAFEVYKEETTIPKELVIR